MIEVRQTEAFIEWLRRLRDGRGKAKMVQRSLECRGVRVYSDVCVQ